MERLQALGLNARVAGPAVQRPNPFKATAVQPIEVEGLTVQVYRYTDEAVAEQALKDARVSPVVEWVARPHFARYGSAVVVVTNDDAAATRITSALR